MSITAVRFECVPQPYILLNAGAPALNVFGAMNASGDKVAWCFKVPKSGTLHSFEFLISAVGNNPDNGLRMSFQDLDASGNPDGTQDQFFDLTGTITTGWKVPGGPLTNDGTGGGTKRTVTADQALACVVDFVSFVASDAVTLNRDLANSIIQDNGIYSNDASTGTYSKQTGSILVLALKYDDGSYAIADFLHAVTAANSRTINTGTTPDEFGLRFQVPVGMRVAGAWVRADVDNAMDVVLYSAADAVLGSGSLVSANRQNTGGSTHRVYFTGGPVDLAANTLYRLVAKPTTASSVIVYDWSINSAGLLDTFPMGAQWYRTQRTDAGAWSDSQTNVPLFGLIVTGADSTVGVSQGSTLINGGLAR